MNAFLAEHRRSMAEQLTKVAQTLPEPAAAKFISQAEGSLVVVLASAASVSTAYAESVAYIENML